MLLQIRLDHGILHNVYVHPPSLHLFPQIGVILTLLWWQLGASAVVAAVAGILFLTPLQFVLCKKIAAVNKNFLVSSLLPGTLAEGFFIQ